LLDRRAGAAERGAAGRDRSTALTDRGSGAAERGQAGDDRDTALSDRGASAVDREHASLDGLTGTYVRGAGLLEFEREVVRAQRTGQPLALAFVDVDHLKAVNDAGGHAAGDRLLAHVADTLRARLRRYDLVVRYGGDEFVCALPGVRAADAEQRFALVNADLAGQGSVTVGIAEHHQDATLAELIAGADRALYAHRAAQRQGQPAPQILPTLP
jgi:diguanylate cyclase (GGDEF)-like protein